MSKIEWTGKNGQTWNPLVGCSRKSDGCKNCYAEIMTKRLEAMGNKNYAGLLNEHGRFNGVVRLNEDNLLKPLSVKKPTTFFVNSMSDLFHENVKIEWIDKVFAVMALCPQHTFQILTKRADRMRDYLTNGGNHPHPHWGHITYWMSKFDNEKYLNSYDFSAVNQLPNVHLGVSVENQKTADERIPLLLETPASVRFLSCEPLLEKVNLRQVPLKDGGVLDALKGIDTRMQCHYRSNIDWVIVGGESGTNARPFNWDWARSIKEQCEKANVKFFMKQGGKNGNKDYKKFESFPQDLQIREIPN